MSGYFRHEAVCEKCGCPGSPSKSQEGERGRSWGGWSRAGKGAERRWGGWSLRPERMRTKDKTKADRALSPRPSPPPKGTRHPIKDAWAPVCSSEHWGLNQVNPHRRPVALSTWWVGVRVGGTADMAKGTTGTNGHVLQSLCSPPHARWTRPRSGLHHPAERAGTKEEDTGKCTPISVVRSNTHTHTRNPRTGSPTETMATTQTGFLKGFLRALSYEPNSSDPRTKASESPFLTSGKSLDSWRKTPQQLLASRPQVWNHRRGATQMDGVVSGGLVTTWEIPALWPPHSQMRQTTTWVPPEAL